VNQQSSTEQQTRNRLIDQDLARAGWSASRRTLIEEFVLSAQPDSPTLGNTPEFADYALLGADGNPIAIVEAKRSSRDELAGKRQASDYADRAAWHAFKELMEAFYEKGLHAGLPFTAAGTPVTQGGITYADFVQAFRDAHRLNPDPNAREVCVLCGGPLGAAPEVDHWIAKHAFPLLSMCADNLLPTCGDCNATSNKGRMPVHDHGSFQDWFHPYFRPGVGAIRLNYQLPGFAVTCAALTPADDVRVQRLDALLNLSQRWTRELKAEYANQQGKLKRYEAQRLSRGQARHTQAEVEAFATSFRDGLLESEPNHEVHRLLGNALLEQARLAAWQTELGLVT